MLSGLDPSVRLYAEMFVGALRQVGLNPRITSVRRSRAAQTKLYHEYLAGRNPYPVAPPGTSRHERGLAFDMVVEQQNTVGRLWSQWFPGHTVWGGSYKDPIHFEFR